MPKKKQALAPLSANIIFRLIKDLSNDIKLQVVDQIKTASLVYFQLKLTNQQTSFEAH